MQTSDPRVMLIIDDVVRRFPMHMYGRVSDAEWRTDLVAALKIGLGLGDDAQEGAQSAAEGRSESEAIQYTGDNLQAVKHWLGDSLEAVRGGLGPGDPQVVWFWRDKNNKSWDSHPYDRAVPGDWIIVRPDGSLSSMRDDEYRRTA